VAKTVGALGRVIDCHDREVISYEFALRSLQWNN
jgi:hypothetical protein